MNEWLLSLDPLASSTNGRAFYMGTDCPWGITWFFSLKVLIEIFYNLMLGFAAGVMIAASVWSLILPAIALSEARGEIAWLATAIGFAAGALLLFGFDKVIPHIHFGEKTSKRRD